MSATRSRTTVLLVPRFAIAGPNALAYAHRTKSSSDVARSKRASQAPLPSFSPNMWSVTAVDLYMSRSFACTSERALIWSSMGWMSATVILSAGGTYIALMIVWSGNFSSIRSPIAWKRRVYLLRICVILPTRFFIGLFASTNVSPTFFPNNSLAISSDAESPRTHCWACQCPRSRTIRQCFALLGVLDRTSDRDLVHCRGDVTRSSARQQARQ